MLVNITKTQFEIITTMGLLSHERKENKKIDINPNSISKKINKTWKTVNINMLKLQNLKGL